MSLIVAEIAQWRRRHRRGWQAPVPVVVVGNWIVGGAGKTPTVLALVQALAAAGERPGIVSRGHGRDDHAPTLLTSDAALQARDVGDEPLLLHRRTGMPVVVGRDRPAAIRMLVQTCPDISVIVSDDGLQHHAMGRDAEIIVFDERGIGNGWCLPAGPLREPWQAAPPPGAWVLYNAAKATTPWPGELVQRQLQGAVTLAAWHRAEAATAAALLALRERRVWAVAGVAFPDRFFEMLRAAGLAITPCPLPDHDPFEHLPWPEGTSDVIVTEKDAIKLEPQRMGKTQVWVAPLDLRLPSTLTQSILAQVREARALRLAR